MFYRNILLYAAKRVNVYTTSALRHHSKNVGWAPLSVFPRKTLCPVYNRAFGSRTTEALIQLLHLQCQTQCTSAGLLKPFLFATGVSAVTVAVAAFLEQEKYRTAPQARKGVWAAQSSEPAWWQSLTESEKVFLPILIANILVFIAWRIRSLQNFMITYFLSGPHGESKYLSLLLAAFSHISFLHLAVNMYILDSFMELAVRALGKEQFFALYIGGALFSGVASLAYKLQTNTQRFSLGASGAIMAVLSFVCLRYPETQLNFILLPMYPFSAITAIKMIMCLDFAGMALGWKIFDHAAHLGGALFGIFWYKWGVTHIWGNFTKYISEIYRSRSGK